MVASANRLEDTKAQVVSSDAADTPRPSPPSEQAAINYTTSLATDPKTIDALSSLDKMWTTSDPSGHTSIATDLEVVDALKQMDDMWKNSQHVANGDDEDGERDASKDNRDEILRDSVWTKASAVSATHTGDESEDDEAPLVGDGHGDNSPSENDFKSIGINGGALLSIAMADAIDMQEEEKAKAPRRFQSQPQPQPRINPLRGAGGLFGLGRKLDGRLSPTEMADQGLLEPDGNGLRTGGYTDNPDESNGNDRQNKRGLFGLGLIPAQGSNSRSVDDEGQSAPLSRSQSKQNNYDDESSSDDGSSKDSSDEANEDDCAENKKEIAQTNPQGTGDGADDLQTKARRGFFRRMNEIERTNDEYALERMEVSKARELEEENNGNWQSKVGKIALGILVPEMYGDEAIEEIEGDTSNARKGKYGQLSMSEDDDTGDEGGMQSAAEVEDDKALEETLRDQIRMLGGRVMELESELMEKNDEVATLSARVAELETKLAQHGAAVEEAWSSNLLD